jgi:hypothetical protein
LNDVDHCSRVYLAQSIKHVKSCCSTSLANAFINLGSFMRQNVYFVRNVAIKWLYLERKQTFVDNFKGKAFKFIRGSKLRLVFKDLLNDIEITN